MNNNPDLISLITTCTNESENADYLKRRAITKHKPFTCDLRGKKARRIDNIKRHL